MKKLLLIMGSLVLGTSVNQPMFGMHPHLVGMPEAKVPQFQSEKEKQQAIKWVDNIIRLLQQYEASQDKNLDPVIRSSKDFLKGDDLQIWANEPNLREDGKPVRHIGPGYTVRIITLYRGLNNSTIESLVNKSLVLKNIDKEYTNNLVDQILTLLNQAKSEIVNQ